MTENLKRSPSDLALAAGRKRQSPRTGFVHTFRGNDEARDAIPLYENYAFVLALFAQKKAETVLEAKDLLSRLFAFQTEEGNFPIYLHDYPRCYDAHLGLKIAPFLLRLLREFNPILGADLAGKLEASLKKILAFTARRSLERPLAPLWLFRYQVCAGQSPSPPDTSFFSPDDWWEYWISLQFLETPTCHFFHPELKAYIGPTYGDAQEYFDPAPALLEWMADLSPRLLKDHPLQLHLSALNTLQFLPPAIPSEQWQLISTPDYALTIARAAQGSFEHAFRLLWGQDVLHSLVLPIGRAKIATRDWETLVELPPGLPDDLFEVALYADARLEFTVDGQKGTAFTFGQRVSLGAFSLTFELIRGTGDFCGHLLRSNRPCQIATTGARQYESYDWKIGLRTLRRSDDCAIKIFLRKE